MSKTPSLLRSFVDHPANESLEFRMTRLFGHEGQGAAKPQPRIHRRDAEDAEEELISKYWLRFLRLALLPNINI
jgi:hypothetical protein